MRLLAIPFVLFAAVSLSAQVTQSVPDASKPAAAKSSTKPAAKPAASSRVKTAQPAVKSGTPSASTSKASQVYRDPVTGELGGPPPDSAPPLSPVTTEPDSAPISVTTDPDGSITAVLPESSMVQIVVTKNEDGTLSFHERTNASPKAPIDLKTPAKADAQKEVKKP